MRVFKQQFFNIILLILVALFLRLVIVGFFLEQENIFIRIAAVIFILVVGAFYIIRGTAKVIEETTDVLKDRTKLAGGFLQSFGTAFPDMVIGIVAAVLSLKVASTDYLRAVNLAIVAAATTFGSNIYNIGYSTWCIFRQNTASRKDKIISIIPFFNSAGSVRPVKQHAQKPYLIELDTAITVLSALTILTALVAVSMVIWGRVQTPGGFSGDLYRMTRPVGIFILLLSILVLYRFRKSHKPESIDEEIIEEEKYYSKKSAARIWFDLLLAGVAILFAAESMVRAVEQLVNITGVPFVIAGVLTGIIGCLGEMIVVHRFVANPNGRIGDAVMGVAMDNIVTTLGASVVAILGGIFLGGNALILIFVVILAINTLLIREISVLKGFV
jgi:hypothetical protein